GQAAGAGADDGNALLHDLYPSCVVRSGYDRGMLSAARSVAGRRAFAASQVRRMMRWRINAHNSQEGLPLWG
ncbi:hypothetical protein NK942_24250, partial [Salmonella enterica subsp. enterica serovar Typhimurium]|nr:hypothetical protein [Salmonella enterica subsp. enterica serovar Typhimurium]